MFRQEVFLRNQRYVVNKPSSFLWGRQSRKEQEHIILLTIRVYTGFFIFSLLVLYNNARATTPWFNGPLLAPAGHTLSKGHTSLGLSAFATLNHTIAKRHGKLARTIAQESDVLNTVFSHGLSDKVDLQFSLPYAHNHNPYRNMHRLGDAIVTLGYQLIEQEGARWRPNLRLTLQEFIPTGRYEKLAPLSNGADATGSGSYQTALAFNFEHLAELYKNHFLRTRLSFFFLYANSVYLTGFNSYGGSAVTNGRIWPGNIAIIDFASELTLTQNWVAVLESFIAERQKTHFKGYAGFDHEGKVARIGHDTMKEITLAPAIEYNFSPHLGITGGSWFSVGGKKASHFISYVIALNVYW